MWSFNSAAIRSMAGRRDSNSRGSVHSVTSHTSQGSISSLKESRGLDDADAMSDASTIADDESVVSSTRSPAPMWNAGLKPAIVQKLANTIVHEKGIIPEPEDMKTPRAPTAPLARTPVIEIIPRDITNLPRRDQFPARTQASASFWSTEANAPKVVQKLANTIISEDDDKPKKQIVPEQLATQVVCKNTQGNKKAFAPNWRPEAPGPKVVPMLGNTVLPEEDDFPKKEIKPYTFTPRFTTQRSKTSSAFWSTETAEPKVVPKLANTYLPMDDTPPKPVATVTPATVSKNNNPVSLLVTSAPKVIPMLFHTKLPRDDDTDSEHTLADHDYEFPEKFSRRHIAASPMVPTHDILLSGDEDEEEEERSRRARGPLERQLAALMTKVIAIERKNPTISVSPTEYHRLQNSNRDLERRVAQLEAEKVAMFKRYEAIYAIRDEELTALRYVRCQLAAERKAHAATRELRQNDISNLVAVRGMLAAERRQHHGLKQLRADDLSNLVVVRGKLAHSIRRIDSLERTSARSQSAAALERSPERERHEERQQRSSSRDRPRSIVMERRNTLASDLFTVAKNAAFEQRALELERANSELTSQVKILKMQAESTPHFQAAAVQDLEIKLARKEEELAAALEGGASGNSDVKVTGNVTVSQWSRVEAMHEEGLKYREKIGASMQRLRSEKELLQRELNRKEDECAVLESKVERLSHRLVKA